MSRSSGGMHLEVQCPARDPAVLVRQARQLQEHFLDLYTYLAKRDRAIERLLARIPSPADLELSSVFNSRAYLEQALWELPPSIGELCDKENCHDW
ncbi:hypothetical protein BH23CHL2_BH23CHL2_34630 [soil metagenome]